MSDYSESVDADINIFTCQSNTPPDLVFTPLIIRITGIDLMLIPSATKRVYKHTDVM